MGERSRRACHVGTSFRGQRGSGHGGQSASARRGAAALSVGDIAAALGLAKHREGGYFRETYRSTAVLDTARGRRSAATAILFLVTLERPSLLHRLASDELWLYQAGAAVELALLGPGVAPEGSRSVLGPPDRPGTVPQLLVPAGVWQGARVVAPRQTPHLQAHGRPLGVQRTVGMDSGADLGADWSLVACVVSPGFDYADFELARADVLERDFPAAVELVRAFS